MDNVIFICLVKFQLHRVIWEARLVSFFLSKLWLHLPDLESLAVNISSVGTWGGGKDHMASIEEEGAKTVTCKLPKAMLPVVVGDDGKIVADIARSALP